MSLIQLCAFQTNKVDKLTLTDIRQKFASVDVGGDGKISRAEIEEAEKKGVSQTKKAGVALQE
jgi:hypothetical protein